jgi:hypothetical protein
MKKPVIVIKVTAKQFKALVLLIQHVIANMTANLNFLTPSPTLLACQTALDNLIAAITKWGPKGNRGSHQDYVDLKVKAQIALSLLTQLSEYCMTVVDPLTSYATQTTILLSSGFPLKNASMPQGVLQMVQNFRNLISVDLNPDQIKLKWKKPLNVTSQGNVKIYNVYRNTSNVFSTAKIIASVPSTTYTDTPGTGAFYYWVVARNNAGDGVVSNVVIFTYTNIG